MSAQPVISTALIVPQLNVTDWQGAIEALGAKLRAAGYVHETYVPAVIDREGIFPTGLPLGGELNVAIPHTDTVHVITPGIAVGTLTQPVTFRQMGDPDSTVEARIVFLLAMKDPQAQVTLLQNLCDIFQKEEVLNQLIAATDAAEIEAIMQKELQIKEVA